MNNVETGLTEIVVVGKALFTQDADFIKINAIKWKAVIIDEFHEYKNNSSNAYKHVEAIGPLKNEHRPIIGLTGTLMQNAHKELWCLSQLVKPGGFGDLSDFTNEYVQPISNGRKKSANKGTVALGQKRSTQLQTVLSKIYIARKKDDVLADTLKKKNEIVIFTEITQVQKQLYQHVLSLPEWQLLIRSEDPCNCSVNNRMFSKFNKLKNDKSKKAFLKANQHVKRKDCCYVIPSGPEPGEMDPLASIWHKQHPNGQCQRCPGCMTLPAMSKLYKICSHPSLIQAKLDPHQMRRGGHKESEIVAMENDVRFAKVALPNSILEIVSPEERSPVRSPRITDDHTLLSGKLKSLAVMCRHFKQNRDRLLIFSQSTQSLDLIGSWIQSVGYTYCRLDGSTPPSRRQALIDSFQSDSNIFCFLISTRAGGIGLNLTAANRVIIYDVNWNPSYDEQAQDRAFRIGQNRDIDVYRLVARGTIEELMYMRQIYKIHLTRQTLISRNDDGIGGGGGGYDDSKAVSAPPVERLFNGVANDNKQKGELFGLHNLLKYKDGSFMADIVSGSSSSSGGGGGGGANKSAIPGLSVYNEDQISKAVTSAKEEEGGFSVDSNFSRGLDDDGISQFDVLGIDRTSVVNQREYMKPGDVITGESEDGGDNIILQLVVKEKR